MGWNEPNDNSRDPWGGRRNDQGPPDLDEVMRKLQQKLGSLFGRRPSPGAPRTGSGPPTPLWPILLVIASLWLSYDMFWRIDSAERGVVLRFGKFVTTLLPGPHFRFPRPIERVIKVNIEQIRGFSVTSNMLTKDENIVALELAVQYRIKDIKNYLLRIADPDETTRRTAESAIRETIGRNKFDFVINEGRAEVAARAEKLMQQMLDDYQSGIEVTSVNMLSATAPDEVKSAFDDAIKSREDKQRKINEAEAYRSEIVERTQGDAARIRFEAEAYKKQVAARAEGDARRFEQLAVAYARAPATTRQRLYIETVQEVLTNSSKVMVEGKSNQLSILPLDKLFARKPEVGAEEAAKVVQVVPDPDQYTAASPVEAPARPRDSRDRNSR